MSASTSQSFTNAFQRTRDYLFQPFQISRWFIVGFAAWLAFLGENGGNYNYNFSGDETGPAIPRWWIEFTQSPYFIPALIALGLAFIIITLIWLWLNARGKFVFLFNVAEGRDAIKVPWQKYARASNAFWLWKVALFSIGVLVILPAFATGTLWIALKIFPESEWLLEFVPANVRAFSLQVGLPALVLGLGLGLASTILNSLLDRFVIPIMYKREYNPLQAWQQLVRLIQKDFWSFVRYYIMLLLIELLCVLVRMLAYLLTCCILALVDLLPYVGAVVFLPLQVYKQFYTLEFLKQCHPDLNLLLEKSEQPESPTADYFPSTRDPGTPEGNTNPYRP